MQGLAQQNRPRPPQLEQARGVPCEAAPPRERPCLSDKDGDALAELIDCGALRPDPDPLRDRLDIRLATLRQLDHEGVESSRVALCPLCTVAEPLLFHSWRRDQVKVVNWSGIVDQS